MALKPKTFKFPTNSMQLRKPSSIRSADKSLKNIQGMSKLNYIGGPYSFDMLLDKQVLLNELVMEKINDTEELVMLNSFSKELNDYELKTCLQERISDIAAWRWVLNDLSKRLEEVVSSLRYEHKALRVVVQRVKKEIEEFSGNATKPGALGPFSDTVEEAILQEYKFLRAQKKKFEVMIADLDIQTSTLEKTKKRIKDDVIGKEKALVVEERCVNFEVNRMETVDVKKINKRPTPLVIWERRCENLKRTGLEALTNAMVIRKQVRGARVQLSRAAQAHASKVDTVLRRRLHINQLKFEELKWQKEEVQRDLQCLDEELAVTESTVLSNIERIGVLRKQVKERKLKPRTELTKDLIDLKLKNELSRLKRFNKELRRNIKSIHSLQSKLTRTSLEIVRAMQNLILVIELDESRISARLGIPPKSGNNTKDSSSDTNPPTSDQQRQEDKSYEVIANTLLNTLHTIPEENEDDLDDDYDGTDDYPFDF